MYWVWVCWSVVYSRYWAWVCGLATGVRFVVGVLGVGVLGGGVLAMGDGSVVMAGYLGRVVGMVVPASG